MFLLLNAVVVRTQMTLELPPGLERLAQLSATGVLNAGCELYAKHPRLERDKPDIARWYSTLIVRHFPDAGAALFRSTPHGYVAHIADVPLPTLVNLWELQSRGLDITAAVNQEVWAAPKLLA